MQKQGIFSMGGLKIMTITGIPVYLNITILFLVAPWFRALPQTLAIEFALLVVLSILFHELGHALVAKAYQQTGISITLHGFGGFASISGSRTLLEDLWITLAGPAATFLTAALFYVMSVYAGDGVQGRIFGILAELNVGLGVINMIPLMPWDGGRALANLLSLKMGPERGFRIVGFVGLVLAPAVAYYGYISGRSTLFYIFAFLGFVTSLSYAFGPARSASGDAPPPQ